MVEHFRKQQVIQRLKKKTCEQQKCSSDNKDNIEFITFDCQNAKKEGLMCSQCFADSQLLQELMPIEHHALPIRKYLIVLLDYYSDYVKLKNSKQWGPTVIKSHKDSLKKQIEELYSDSIKSLLEITQFIDKSTKMCLEEIKKISQDIDLSKIFDFFNEQNDAQQQRMILSGQLLRITTKLKRSQGKTYYSPQSAVKLECQGVLIRYKETVAKGVAGLKGLVEVHKNLLKKIMA